MGRDHSINKHFKERVKLLFRFGYVVFVFSQRERREGGASFSRRCRVKKENGLVYGDSVSVLLNNLVSAPDEGKEVEQVT